MFNNELCFCKTFVFNGNHLLELITKVDKSIIRLDEDWVDLEFESQSQRVGINLWLYYFEQKLQI